MRKTVFLALMAILAATPVQAFYIEGPWEFDGIFAQKDASSAVLFNCILFQSGAAVSGLCRNSTANQEGSVSGTSDGANLTLHYHGRPAGNVAFDFTATVSSDDTLAGTFSSGDGRSGTFTGRKLVEDRR
jgi:hypothetical protein